MIVSSEGIFLDNHVIDPDEMVIAGIDHAFKLAREHGDNRLSLPGLLFSADLSPSVELSCEQRVSPNSRGLFIPRPDLYIVCELLDSGRNRIAGKVPVKDRLATQLVLNMALETLVEWPLPIPRRSVRTAP